MQHTDLQHDRWAAFSVVEQMAHIGSEIIRSMNWKRKDNKLYADLANERALELFDMSLSQKQSPSAFREIARTRELWLDYYLGDNKYQQTEEQWSRYFIAFNTAAGLRRQKQT